jgi:hypothetical protein
VFDPLFSVKEKVKNYSFFLGDPSSASTVLVMAGCTPYCGEKKKVGKKIFKYSKSLINSV